MLNLRFCLFKELKLWKRWVGKQSADSEVLSWPCTSLYINPDGPFMSVRSCVACKCWCVQVHQERIYQEYSLSRAESQLKQMEKMLTQQNQSRELELTALKGEIASLKKVNDTTLITTQDIITLNL